MFSNSLKIMACTLFKSSRTPRYNCNLSSVLIKFMKTCQLIHFSTFKLIQNLCHRGIKANRSLLSFGCKSSFSKFWISNWVTLGSFFFSFFSFCFHPFYSGRSLFLCFPPSLPLPFFLSFSLSFSITEYTSGERVIISILFIYVNLLLQRASNQYCRG